MNYQFHPAIKAPVAVSIMAGDTQRPEPQALEDRGSSAVQGDPLAGARRMARSPRATSRRAR